MNCPNCGSPLSSDATFCPSCGASVADINKKEDQGSAPDDGYITPSVPQPQQQQYQQQNQQQYQQPQQPYRSPIKERSIPLYVILSILTCGFFALYWFVVVVNDLNTATNSPNDTSGGMVLLLSIVTCDIYGMYWMFKGGEKVTTLKQRRGLATGGYEGVLFLLLQLCGLGIINLCLIQNELNHAALGN